MDRALHPLCADALNALAHETPFFVISNDVLLGNLRCFRECFPGAAIHYAIKANAERQVLCTLAAAGAGFEIASAHELRLALEVGVSPERIIYGTSVKPHSHIQECYSAGVDRFACDSPEELAKIAAVAPGARVYVRLAVNDTASVFRFSEKFGTTPDRAVELLREAGNLGLKPYGLSFHVGSQARDASAWAEALKPLPAAVAKLQDVGIRLVALNIGGGFPCRYTSIASLPTVREIAAIVSAGLRALPYQPQLILEPGRGIAAEAAVLITSVIGRVQREGRTWLFLDAGVYNALFEAMAYQGCTQYPVESVRVSSAGEASFALAGPTGDSPDVITREILLPRDTGLGDRLIVRNAGAYTLSVTSEFNGFPKPAVWYV